jgi:hypothetical protein
MEVFVRQKDGRLRPQNGLREAGPEALAVHSRLLVASGRSLPEELTCVPEGQRQLNYRIARLWQALSG